MMTTLVETCSDELLKWITFIENGVARETVKKLIHTKECAAYLMVLSQLSPEMTEETQES
jgi:hypothetical protein